MERGDHDQAVGAVWVSPGKSTPGIGGVATLQQYDLNARHEVQQSHQWVNARFPLGRAWLPVDVPGVCVPRSDVTRGETDGGEHFRLPLSCRIIVLKAQEA
jgi:hypothetical protein